MSDQGINLEKYRALIGAGIDIEPLIAMLRDDGLSKMGSIRVLVDLNISSLADAKRLVHCSPVWSDVRKRDDELHEKLAKAAGG